MDLTKDFHNYSIPIFLIDQYSNSQDRIIYDKHVPYSISNLIISQNFYDKDINIIESILNDLNPTSAQLSYLSNSEQKLFYSTINEILKGYTGTNAEINEYKNLLEEILEDPNPDKDNKFQDISSNKYTIEEFKASKLIDRFLLDFFGYRFAAMLKMGVFFFSKDSESEVVSFQPLLFPRRLFIENLNKRRIRSISTADKSAIYRLKNPTGELQRIVASFIVFGHLTRFDIIGEESQSIYMYGVDSFLSDLTTNVFNKPSNLKWYYVDYGKLTGTFIARYESFLLPDATIRKNIDGKTAMMNGFAKLYKTRFTPTVVQNIGLQSGVTIFQNNPDIISKSSFNYAILDTFQQVVNPASEVMDPTNAFRRVYRGDLDYSSFRIGPISMETAGWFPLWRQDRSLSPNLRIYRPQDLGLVNLDSTTMTQFFENDFYTIQPSLYYTYLNIKAFNQRDLSVQELLNNEFIEKIDHLRHNLYESIETKYDNGQQLTVTFHQDTSNGIYDNGVDASGVEHSSLLSNVIPLNIRAKFPELFDGDGEFNSLSITIQKEAGIISNIEEFQIFITSLTFYLVMFNSIALIQDGSGSIGMIASQRELFSSDYIFQLDDVELSPIGQQILSTYQAGWNVNNEGNIVWNYGDCWPINLFSDARRLMDWFSTHFLRGARIKELS